MIEEKAPFALIYNATTSRNASPLQVPAIRLPIMDAPETVTKVVAHADFDADQEVWRRRMIDAEGSPEPPG
jgi:hypothetical protein